MTPPSEIARILIFENYNDYGAAKRQAERIAARCNANKSEMGPEYDTAARLIEAQRKESEEK